MRTIYFHVNKFPKCLVTVDETLAAIRSDATEIHTTQLFFMEFSTEECETFLVTKDGYHLKLEVGMEGCTCKDIRQGHSLFKLYLGGHLLPENLNITTALAVRALLKKAYNFDARMTFIDKLFEDASLQKFSKMRDFDTYEKDIILNKFCLLATGMQSPIYNDDQSYWDAFTKKLNDFKQGY